MARKSVSDRASSRDGGGVSGGGAGRNSTTTPTSAALDQENNNLRGFLADAFEMFKYFAVLAVHLTKAVCVYIGCRLDEYAERALIDEEGEELDVEELRRKMEIRRRKAGRKRGEGGGEGGEEDELDEDEEEDVAR